MIKMKNIKAIFRRGPSQTSSKNETSVLQQSSAHSTQDDLSRSSSSNNLNSLDSRRTAAVIRSKKSLSKEKLERFNDKENDASGLSSNRSEPEEEVVAIDEATVREIEQLRYQLKDMAIEKSELSLELAENRNQLQLLKNEVIRLKTFQDQSNLHIQQLNEENVALRNRLRDVAHSPLSDNEKQMLLESHRHSSAPASIATNVVDENATTGDVTTCTTPEWDKYSSSNVSEVSVACLQDKINQMQETHYSTNEELQATLQELTDLQRQLTELQQDNERLLDEKNLMFDSLCRQTERLNNARTEVESLKQLLCIDKENAPDQFESIVDREQKLVDLLKKGQQERETLLVKLEQLNNEVQELRTLNHSQIQTIEQLTERVRTLESSLDAKHAEHRQLDKELAIAKDLCNVRQIEIDRLTGLLDNAKTKIGEIEQERALNDKSELDELLDNVRKEKDTLECEVANLKEQVAYSRNESEKLREQVSILQEECKVSRNNAKCTQAELEYKCELLTLEKNNLTDQLHQLQEAVNELQVQAQCHVEDKRQLSSVLSETQRNLSETEKRNADLENEIEELKKIRREENDEWEKFQNDLLTSVRVANDFKSEAQQELQKMIMENKSHRERVRQLEAQIDKLKGTTTQEESTLINTVKNDDFVILPPPCFSDNEKNSSSNSDTIFEKTANFIKSLKEKPNFYNKYFPIDKKKFSSTETVPEMLLKDDDDKKTRRCSADELFTSTRTIYKPICNELKKSKSYDTSLNEIIPENELLKQKKTKKKFNFFKKSHTKDRNVAISLPTINSVILNPKLAAYINDRNTENVILRDKRSCSESELIQIADLEDKAKSTHVIIGTDYKLTEIEQNPLHWVFLDSDLNIRTLAKRENCFRSSSIVLHQSAILFECKIKPYIRIIHNFMEEIPYYCKATIFPSCHHEKELRVINFIIPYIFHMSEVEIEKQKETITFTTLPTIRNSLNEQVRAKLTDEEYQIIEKLQSSPRFTRPISDINEDDLKLIEYAKAQYSSDLETEDDYFEYEPIYENFASLSVTTARVSHKSVEIKKPPVPVPRSSTVKSDNISSCCNDLSTLSEQCEQFVDYKASTSNAVKNKIIKGEENVQKEDALDTYLERKKSEVRRINSRTFNVQLRNSKSNLDLNNRQSFEKAKWLFENISRK